MFLAFRTSKNSVICGKILRHCYAEHQLVTISIPSGECFKELDICIKFVNRGFGAQEPLDITV